MDESAATKVDSAPALDSVTKHEQKGNREAEEAIDNEVPVKKQKLESEAKKQENAGLSDLEEEQEDKNIVPLGKVPLPIAIVKDEPLEGSKKDKSSNDSESNDDHKNFAKDISKQELPATAAKNGSFAVTEKKNETSHSSKEESTLDVEDIIATNDILEMASLATVTKQKADVKEMNSEEVCSKGSSGEDPQSQNLEVLSTDVKSSEKPEEKESSICDDEPPKLQSINMPIQDLNKDINIEEQSSEDDASEEDEERTCMTPDKTDTDVEMVDAASAEQTGPLIEKEDPQPPGTSSIQATGSKTLFVGNLSFSVEQTDVEDFFKDIGEIVSMRFSVDREGAFKGFGHVEFATVEAAQKAMQLNRQELLGRRIKLDYAREKGSYTPNSGNENSSTMGGRVQGQKIYVRGFDTNDGEEKIRSALKEHFGSCGEISTVSIPRDYEGSLKGIAYIDFKDSDGFNKAMELKGSHLGENTLIVEEAKARDRDSGSVGRFGGGGSGRYGRRDGGGGSYGGRDGGYGSGGYGNRDGSGYGSSGGGYGNRDGGGYGGYGNRDGSGYGSRDGGGGGYGGRDGSGGGYGNRDGGGWFSGRRRW
ncbi:hypothetical protein LguiA_031414 [Lonicera macranthoides]